MEGFELRVFDKSNIWNGEGKYDVWKKNLHLASQKILLKGQSKISYCVC
jgi:hypothetical protein